MGINSQKWPNFQKAFTNFVVEEVAKFIDNEAIKLLEDKNIIRNSMKIDATIHNAKEFIRIKKEWGSFRE